MNNLGRLCASVLLVLLLLLLHSLLLTDKGIFRGSLQVTYQHILLLSVPGTRFKAGFFPSIVDKREQFRVRIKNMLNIQITEGLAANLRSFDVLMQYCMTLAVADGFYGAQLLKEIRETPKIRSQRSLILIKICLYIKFVIIFNILKV